MIPALPSTPVTAQDDLEGLQPVQLTRMGSQSNRTTQDKVARLKWDPEKMNGAEKDALVKQEIFGGRFDYIPSLSIKQLTQGVPLFQITRIALDSKGGTEQVFILGSSKGMTVLQCFKDEKNPSWLFLSHQGVRDAHYADLFTSSSDFLDISRLTTGILKAMPVIRSSLLEVGAAVGMPPGVTKITFQYLGVPTEEQEKSAEANRLKLLVE